MERKNCDRKIKFGLTDRVNDKHKVSSMTIIFKDIMKM